MVLKQIYATLRWYTNFFQPTMRLKSKERLGARVKRVITHHKLLINKCWLVQK